MFTLNPFIRLPDLMTRLHFPTSTAAKCGHVTELWPMTCRQKGTVPPPGLPINLQHNHLYSLFP